MHFGVATVNTHEFSRGLNLATGGGTTVIPLTACFKETIVHKLARPCDTSGRSLYIWTFMSALLFLWASLCNKYHHQLELFGEKDHILFPLWPPAACQLNVPSFSSAGHSSIFRNK